MSAATARVAVQESLFDFLFAPAFQGAEFSRQRWEIPLNIAHVFFGNLRGGMNLRNECGNVRVTRVRAGRGGKDRPLFRAARATRVREWS